MGTKLFITHRDADGLMVLPDGRHVHTNEIPVGAMWPCDCHGQKGWLIRIPGEHVWADGHVFVNMWCTLSRNMDQQLLWDVQGEAPMITVSPSIHCSPGDGPPREWHGHIINGEITG